MVVADIMRRDVEFIPPDTTVQQAAQLMGELDVAALPIGSRTDLRGIVTSRDILFRVVARGLDSSQVKTVDVMSSTVFSCRENDSLETALETMAAHGVRRLPVVDAEGHVVGWITIARIARTLFLEGRLEPEAVERSIGVPL